MMRVLLRTDGGVDLGTGHIMRCLALADELRRRGCQAVFAMRPMPGDLIGEVAEHGYEVIKLAERSGPACGGIGDWLTRLRTPSMQLRDAQEVLRGSAGRSQWDWVVVDHYGLDAIWQEQVRAIARCVLVIDDLADRAHDCNLLLDQNPQFPGRYAALTKPTVPLLLGPGYALLRPEFLRARANTRCRPVPTWPPAVLVSFGGSDEPGITLDVIAALERCGLRGRDVLVLAGSRNPRLEQVQLLCERLGYRCLASTSYMAEVMAGADLCIGAGGTSMIERFSVALPSIIVPNADNQRPGALAAHASGAALLVDVPRPELAGALAQALRRLTGEPGCLERMGQAARALCDGRGTARVATLLQQGALVLRRAGAGDSARLLEWRNAPETRLHSSSGSMISAADHEIWFDAVRGDANRAVWIATLGSEAVGVLRLDTSLTRTGRYAVASVYLVPGRSGVGWGRALIGTGIDQACLTWPDLSRVDAHISPDNHASLRAFAACGFVAGPEPGLYHLFIGSTSS